MKMMHDRTKPELSHNRRNFIKKTIRFVAGIGLLFSPIQATFQNAYAKTKRFILPKDTKMTGLINKNPATLDTRNLEVIPLKDFETMGLTDHQVDLNTWRLEVSGEVKKPLKLTYTHLLSLPAIEKNVLLICPGVFTIHGRWKGISVLDLLKMAEADAGITHVTFRGPEGRYEKVEQFSITEIVSNKVFLAYRVNEQVLPRKHGFPLRIVAEDHYGADWVKYVYKIETYKIES
jgi:sulfoxide reductase catalytic subunit YedY